MQPKKIMDKNWVILFLVMILFILLSPKVYATPSASATYTEIDLGLGLWEYDYTLTNASDPSIDAGFDVYDFTLYIDPSLNAGLSVINSPLNWDQEGSPISDLSSFITWFSNPNSPGAPPSGDDIAPGTSLSGFNFTSDTRLASLNFDVTITNPNDLENPVAYSAASSPETTAVPEPATLLLLCSGLAGLGFLKRRIFHTL